MTVMPDSTRYDCQYCHTRVTVASERAFQRGHVHGMAIWWSAARTESQKAEIKKLRPVWPTRTSLKRPASSGSVSTPSARHAHFPHQRHVKNHGGEGLRHLPRGRGPHAPVWEVNNVNNMGFCITCHVERKVAARLLHLPLLSGARDEPIRERLGRPPRCRTDGRKMNGGRSCGCRRDGTGTAALSGCSTDQVEKLVPYLVQSEDQVPGIPTVYASTCTECSAGMRPPTW